MRKAWLDIKQVKEALHNCLAAPCKDFLVEERRFSAASDADRKWL
jgi:hypothetical protein